MSAISPGRMQDIEGVADPVSVAQTNFEVATQEIFKRGGSYQDGVETTLVGPPTTGTRIVDEFWRDSLGGEWVCIEAGTPGTWHQTLAATVSAEPTTGTIPTSYLIIDTSDAFMCKKHAGGYIWDDLFGTSTASTTAEVFDLLGAMGAAGGIYWRNVDDIDCTAVLTGILRANGSSGPEIISGLTADYMARIGTSGATLVNSLIRDDGSQVSIGAAADAAQLGLQVTGGISLIGASTLKTSVGELTLDTGNSLTMNFKIGGSNGWRISSSSVLESVGAQTIQSSTGNLTIATGAANGNVILAPHGVGSILLGALTGILTGTAGTVSAATGTANTIVKFATTGTIGNSTITDDGTTVTAKSMLYVTSTGVGAGIAAPAARLDILGVDSGLTVLLSDNATDAASKQARVGLKHYTNAEEPMTLFLASNDASDSYIAFGGSTGSMNAVKRIIFYTAADTTTVTGTPRWTITSAGVLEAAAAQSITTAAGALTLAPFAGSSVIVTTSTTGNFAVNTSQLVVDADVGFVGIGTTAPVNKLQVSGRTLIDKFLYLSSQSSAADSVFGFNAFSAAGDGNLTTGPVNLSTVHPQAIIAGPTEGIRFVTTSSWPGVSTDFSISSNEKMRITPTGNVGIGTTSPINTLAVHGSAVAAPATSGTAANGVFRLGIVGDGSSIDFGIASASYAWIQSRARTSYAVNYNLSLNPNGGKVGIGTTSPVYQLDVNGSARIGSPSSQGATLRITAQNTDGSPSQTSMIYMEGYEGRGMGTMYTDVSSPGEEWFAGMPYQGNFDNYQIGYDVSGGQSEYLTKALMTIKSDGNVGIGTTSPGAKLSINGGLHVGLAGTTQGTIGIAGVTSGLVTVTTVAAAGTWTLTLPTAVGTAGYQLTDAAGDGITSWAAAASKREYKNILSTVTSKTDALLSILRTPIYNFKYKDGLGTGDGRTVYTGLLADEAPWAMHFDGGILNPISTFGYTVLSIQALHDKIERLEEKVRTLENR